jgi:lipopolysaccharide/colanic/teichoic acid biosynthesis glycosyltransferase
VAVEHTASSRSPAQVRSSFAVKRALDMTGAAILLVVLSPLFAIVSLAIKLTSSGPVFFIQDRVGAKRSIDHGQEQWNRTVFPALKFRSMYTDADQSAHKQYIRDFVNGDAVENETGPKFKMTADPRITSAGAVIRRTSLDELPQLINVLRGEMSLVGPRPVPKYETEVYSDSHFERFNALPGITGYWQIYGRGRVPFEEMMDMDIYYVRNRSLLLDLKLLLLTAPAVISTKGAI